MTMRLHGIINTIAFGIFLSVILLSTVKVAFSAPIRKMGAYPPLRFSVGGNGIWDSNRIYGFPYSGTPYKLTCISNSGSYNITLSVNTKTGWRSRSSVSNKVSFTKLYPNWSASYKRWFFRLKIKLTRPSSAKSASGYCQFS